MENKISSGTIARTVILVLALANQILLMLGIQAIPIADEDINTVVSTLWTVVSALVAWWKNNSFTVAARIGDSAMREAKKN
ncbi:phage holin [Dysosmobacter sp.]|uniref:phage holin n=1 Tax=Dysosmobacter sp. TaxID=2591382 RepID=UPI002A968253|nr:phage holin [Dysosmobacter sp.]MDY5510269.1 phage holin [Dysosmobacter sp.]